GRSATTWSPAKSVSMDLARSTFRASTSRSAKWLSPTASRPDRSPRRSSTRRSCRRSPSAGRTRGIVAVVSGLVLAGFVAGAVLAVVWPLAIFLLSRRRVTLLLRNVLVGAGVFFVFSQGLEKAFPPFLLKANPPPPPMLQ